MSLLTRAQRSQLTVRPRAVAPLAAAGQIVRQPVEVDILTYAGDDLNWQLVVSNPDGTPTDLSTATVRAQVRATPPDVMDLGDLDVYVYGNAVSIILTAAVSAVLPASAVWDCEMTLDGLVTTLAAGSVTTVTDVTR